MNYTIQENIEISAYEAVLTFDEDIRQYVTNPDFSITLFDLYTNTPKTISCAEFPQYGITELADDFDEREKLSFYAHGGILMYFNGTNSFYFKQMLSCKKRNDDTEYGFHSSKVSLYFAEGKTAEFNSILLPKVHRDSILNQVDDSAKDPVLPENTNRTAFDYDVPVAQEHTADRIRTDYNAGDPEGIYVNTLTNDNTNVPCYYSSLSAFLNTTYNQDDPVEIADIDSYLYDETTNDSLEIAWTSAENTETVEIPFADDYYTTLIYQEFKQYVSADDLKLHKNKLVFDMKVNGIPAPEMLNKLSLTISTTPSPPKLNLTNIEDDKYTTIFIKNYNLQYIDVEPVVNITIDGVTYTPTQKQFDATNGELTIIIPTDFYSDIKTKPAVINTEIVVETYLDVDDPHWSQDAVKSQTLASGSVTWSYEKSKLNRLLIPSGERIPTDGRLINDDTGELNFIIENTNPSFFVTNYASDEAGSKGIYCEVIGTDNVQTISNAHCTPDGNFLNVNFDNIGITDSQEPQLTLRAWNVYDTSEYTHELVMSTTSAIYSPAFTFTRNDIVLDQFGLTISDYEPVDSDAEHAHWISNDIEDFPSVGSAAITVYNPNTDYRLPAEFAHACTYPNGATLSEPDFTNYASDGIVRFTVTNIKLDRDYSAANIGFSAWLNHSFPDDHPYTQTQVKEKTSAAAASDFWKYKIFKPDIHPYNYLANYSLYSLSDLTIDGGKIGSKDLACKNLHVVNGAEILSDIYVAEGCGITADSSNTFSGNVYTPRLVCNNNTNFIKDVYVRDYVYLDNTTINRVYSGANCEFVYRNSSNIILCTPWTDPEFPELPQISAEEVITGPGDFTNNAIFGRPNEYTIGNYNSLDINNNNNSKIATFYPGKYYFNTIHTETDTIFAIENGNSDDGVDRSVMIYAKDLQLGNNIQLRERSNGPFDFRLYYDGTSTATIGVQGNSNAGTIIAPHGTVEFQNAATWYGHVWAEHIILRNGASIDNNV